MTAITKAIESINQEYNTKYYIEDDYIINSTEDFDIYIKFKEAKDSDKRPRIGEYVFKIEITHIGYYTYTVFSTNYCISKDFDVELLRLLKYILYKTKKLNEQYTDIILTKDLVEAEKKYKQSQIQCPFNMLFLFK